MPVVVRPATPDDLPRIALIERSCFPDPWSDLSLTFELANPGSVVLVSVERGADGADAPLAYAAYRVTADEAELLRLAVLPEVRRLGHARRLLAAGRRRLAARRCTTCYLEVRAENRPAIALYESFGFHPIGRRRGYYGPDRDALLYAGSVAAPQPAPAPAAARRGGGDGPGSG